MEQTSFLDRFFGWFKPANKEATIVEEPKQTRQKPKRQDRGGRRSREGRERSSRKTGNGQQKHGSNGVSTNGTGGTLTQGRGVAGQHSSQTEQKGQAERSSNKKQPRSSRDERVRAESKSLIEGEKLPVENKTVQGEDGGRPRRRRGGKQRERNEHAPERDGQIRKAVGTSGKEAKKYDSDNLPKQTSDEISIDSPAPKKVAKKSEEVRLAPPINTTTDKNEFIPEKESNISHVLSDSEKSSVSEKTVKEPIISLAMSAPVSEVEEPKLSSECEPKKVSQAVPLSGSKSEDLTTNKLVMIETIQEKITALDNATTEDSALPKQRRVKSDKPPAEVNEPLVQIETHK